MHINGREMSFALEVFTRRLEPGSGITIPLVYLEGFWELPTLQSELFEGFSASQQVKSCSSKAFLFRFLGVKSAGHKYAVIFFWGKIERVCVFKKDKAFVSRKTNLRVSTVTETKPSVDRKPKE